MKSWRTTILGILAALSLLGPQLTAILDDDPTTNPDWSVIFAALGIGGAGVVSRDNGVSSEDAGVKGYKIT